MKYILSLIFLCCALIMPAQTAKMNYRSDQIRPFTVTISKMKVEGDHIVLYGKVKQRKNFSYSISFADCRIVSKSVPEGVQGTLSSWNDDKKVTRVERTVSDEDDEQFTITFPSTAFIHDKSFDFKIGNILDRNKTELLYEGVKAK